MIPGAHGPWCWGTRSSSLGRSVELGKARDDSFFWTLEEALWEALESFSSRSFCIDHPKPIFEHAGVECPCPQDGLSPGRGDSGLAGVALWWRVF